MNPCIACGQPACLRGNRISFGRKRGVAHYIDHVKLSECRATAGWTVAILKPYPKREEDKPYWQMIQRWNAANPEALPSISKSQPSKERSDER
jgi:hypothetical protein